LAKNKSTTTIHYHTLYSPYLYTRACAETVRRNSPLRNTKNRVEKMYVVKRDGRQEAVHFDKITARLKKLSYGLSTEHCDPVLVSQKVCAGVYKGVTTSQLDELAAETAAALTANHPDYASVSFLFFIVVFVIRGLCNSYPLTKG